MERISPVWILTSLTGEAFDKFKEAIDQQFKAFSETELNGFEDCETHQWWGVETTEGGLDSKWDSANGYPNGIPAYFPDRHLLFDGQQGIVIFYAPLSEFTRESSHIYGLKSNEQFFPDFGGNRFFYGITSFQKHEAAQDGFLKLVRKIQEDEQSDNRLFNSITFLSNSSHNAHENSGGYQTLEEDDFLSLVTNTIFTIAITKRELHQLNIIQQRLFNTAGVFSFTYEPDAMKKRKAYHLAEQLMDAFCNNDRDPNWYNENEAQNHFNGSSLKKNLHWYSVYRLLSQGFQEESMQGLYSQCEVSPWLMFAYKLVPVYFRRYVKTILNKTYNNVHNFASLTQMRYESFVKKRRQQVLDGTAEIEAGQQFAQVAIVKYLGTVWDPSYEGAKGLKQVLLLLGKVKDYLVQQKQEVGRVKAFEEPNDDKHKGFPKLEDYPLKEIDKKENAAYKSHYEEFVTNGEPPAENTVEADKTYEERLLSVLHNILKWHAMPLNLFTKAGLLSVLIFVTVWSAISIIQSTDKVHIFSLETDRSLIALFVASAVIVLAFAFVRYGLKTLRKIRLIMQKYIAWSYYKVQREVYRLSLEEEGKYYDALIGMCGRIEDLLNAFILSEINEKPSFTKYKVSKFQRCILEDMDNDNNILKDTALHVSLQINNMNLSLDEAAQDLLYAMLRENSRNLSEKMCDGLLKETESGNSKQELLDLWSDILKEHIQITINGQYGDAVDFPAFHNSSEPLGNFTIEAWRGANALIYPSVYVYAMRPHSCVFSIVPNGDGHVSGSRWENIFYGPEQSRVNQKVPDFANVQNPPGWLTTKQIALFMRIHAYNRLIVDGNDGQETTIFNNQLI